METTSKDDALRQHARGDAGLTLVRSAVLLAMAGQALIGFARAMYVGPTSPPLILVTEQWGRTGTGIASFAVGLVCLLALWIRPLRVVAGMAHAVLCFSISVATLGSTSDFWPLYMVVYPLLGITVAAASRRRP
ncbi:hypothetical protein EON81_18255 [bacterium]|nr:MAG: hypothetical protein EON81_18255 [bacterium]